MTTERPSILLVEDDPVLGKGLQLNLELSQYKVNWTTTLTDARNLPGLMGHSLVILDVGLPDGTGFDLCRWLREQGLRCPVIFLTAQTDEDSVVRGFTEGANDYVRKPFSNKELLARIQHHLNEPVVKEEQTHLGPIHILVDQRKVLIDGKTVPLNRKEFDIFCYLTRNSKIVLSREKILEAVNPSGDLSDRTIDSHLSHIRQKLKDSQVENVKIQSVYGVGYKLEIT
jgi:DNA-binding response OmpR family regulator